MKLVVLYNDLDDCLLYIDGKSYQDIDYRWMECMMWLSDTVTGFNIDFVEVNLHRSKFPDNLKVDKKMDLEKVFLSGGRRTNIAPSEWLEDWWVGFGKDESCQFEGSWSDLVNLAEQILAHPNTALIKIEKDLNRLK